MNDFFFIGFILFVLLTVYSAPRSSNESSSDDRSSNESNDDDVTSSDNDHIFAQWHLHSWDYWLEPDYYENHDDYY